jgi:Xaa-Pro aminopeptidase
MATAPLDQQQRLPALMQKLSEAGHSLSEEALESLLQGVAAAPGADGGNGPADAWMDMIGEELPADIRAGLAQRLQATLDDLDDGLAPPCPSWERISALRTELAARNLGGFIIPLADEHQGEYVPKRAQRLTWLTGFTGSAGTAIVLADKAAIFVDGRYTLQAANQVDASVFDIVPLGETPLAKWIEANLSHGANLGFDPWLHTTDGMRRLSGVCAKAGGALSPVETNPIDQMWSNQPAAPLSPMTLQLPDFAGESSTDKRRRLAEDLKNAKQDAVILTAPDSIAWLANIRGGDVPYTPFCLSFAILHAGGGLDLFVDPRKVPASVRGALDDGITISGPDGLENALQTLGKAKATVCLDTSSAAHAIYHILEKSGAVIGKGEDPCAKPKARKNVTELNGIRTAHIRDGAALSRFLCWLDREAPKGGVTEICAADQLEAFRREGDHIRGLSFPTISGAGPNGAIVHYRVSEESNRALETGSLYLVDSGAQYLDGTTDVTRTIAIGEPTAEMRDRFTRVLKGHIALAIAVFPKGASGSQLDILARAALWQAGIDYEHGTGHGVGAYLGVHEGPQRISTMPSIVALEPGMVISNEPGYYKTDGFGIRIENLVTVIEAAPIENSEKDMLAFETLTLAPIDVRLVDQSLLSKAEIRWLNDYHQRVRETLTPLVDPETTDWLSEATKPL